MLPAWIQNSCSLFKISIVPDIREVPDNEHDMITRHTKDTSSFPLIVPIIKRWIPGVQLDVDMYVLLLHMNLYLNT